MCVCFGLRLAMFMVRPLGGCVPSGAFWAFGYIIPEILPALIEMFVVISTADSKIRSGTTMSSSMNSMSSNSTPLSASSFGSDNGKPGMEVRPLLQREDSVLMEVRRKTKTIRKRKTLVQDFPSFCFSSVKVPELKDSDVSFDELSEVEQRAAIEAEIAAAGDLGVEDGDMDIDYSAIDDDITSKLRSGVDEASTDLN